MEYAICIPAVTHNEKCSKLLHNLLTSISWGQYKCPVIVCFDNSSGKDVEHFQKEFPFITSLLYQGDKNLNFCKNSNRGLRFINEEFKVGTFLVNQDVVLPFHTVLERIINKGISSPEPIHIDGEVTGKFFNLNKMADPGCPCNKTLSPTGVRSSLKFAAFCMWISPEAFEKIGYLDGNIFESTFEDDDYCLRANLAKLPCEVYDVKVHHELKDREVQISTTGSYDANTLGDHMQRFMRKYAIPSNIPHDKFAEYVIKYYQGYPPVKVL